uniref:GDSL esterase/lipase n=1 Tax=Adineta vaga TaxID=104782 RepID=A0A1W6BR02_ADIVA|nr:GDSL esterase/lipase [Adineta vaga]
MSHYQQHGFIESSTISSSPYSQQQSLSSNVVHRFSNLSLSSVDSHHPSMFPPHPLERNSHLQHNHCHSPDIPLHRLSLNHPHHPSPSTSDDSRSSYLLLSDSHGRYFPPIFETPEYLITTYSISGLSWSNSHNPSLCAYSMLSSSSFSLRLSTFSRLLFLIGSNSIRSTNASIIMNHIEHLIDFLRITYPHLSHPTAIGIIYTFPCYKTSDFFPTISSLHLNLNDYNSLLRNLALKKHFLVLDLSITPAHINRDGLHLHPIHSSTIWSSIVNYFASSVRAPAPSSRTHVRSSMAILMRNRKRHAKLSLRQQQFVVIRSIDPLWRLSDVKDYLHHQQIMFANIANIRNQQVTIRFNNLSRQKHAEQTLFPHVFEAAHYYCWKGQVH